MAAKGVIEYCDELNGIVDMVSNWETKNGNPQPATQTLIGALHKVSIIEKLIRSRPKDRSVKPKHFRLTLLNLIQCLQEFSLLCEQLENPKKAYFKDQSKTKKAIAEITESTQTLLDVVTATAKMCNGGALPAGLTEPPPKTSAILKPGKLIRAPLAKDFWQKNFGKGSAIPTDDFLDKFITFHKIAKFIKDDTRQSLSSFVDKDQTGLVTVISFCSFVREFGSMWEAIKRIILDPDEEEKKVDDEVEAPPPAYSSSSSNSHEQLINPTGTPEVVQQVQQSQQIPEVVVPPHPVQPQVDPNDDEVDPNLDIIWALPAPQPEDEDLIKAAVDKGYRVKIVPSASALIDYLKNAKVQRLIRAHPKKLRLVTHNHDYHPDFDMVRNGHAGESVLRTIKRYRLRVPVLIYCMYTIKEARLAVCKFRPYPSKLAVVPCYATDDPQVALEWLTFTDIKADVFQKTLMTRAEAEAAPSPWE